MKAVTREERRVAYPLVLIFALLAAGILTTGNFYYRHYERQFRADAERQLSAIAELKVNELVQYRKERLWDAATLFKNDAFSGLVQRFLEHPEDAEAQPQIQNWAAKYLATDQYDLICLFDAQGVIRMAVPVEPPISSFVSQNIPEILRSGRVTFQDFIRNEHDQRAYLALLVPIFDGTDHSQALGVLALRIDPETYLYPFIRRWPVPSETAETLLVRREGNDALFLNELKFGTNTALNRRISIENTNLPAVKAVLGQEGIVEGRDYRGVPTLAALHAIPDSPWSLVAKMDTAEVYAPMRERLRLTILLVSLLLISTAASIGAIWRHQRVRFYKERYKMAEALRRSETKFRTLYDLNSDAVMLLDEKNFFDCNPATLAMFGCATREEFCSKHPADVSPPVQPDGMDSLTLANQRIAAALARGTEHFEWMHKRADTGETFPADVLLNAMELDGKPVLQAVVRDITARKRAEEELRNSRALYFSLVENLPQSVFRKDRAGHFLFVNEQFCQGLRRSPEDIVGRTDADFFPPELAQAYRKDDLRVMETGQILNQEEKYVWADGRELFVHIIKTPLRDTQGQIIGVQGVFWDITDRRRAEESLRYEQTLTATLMENVPDAIYFKDTASRFLRANRALSRKFGLSDPAQLIGKSDADFFSGEHAQQALADEQEILRTGRPLLNVEEKETWMDGTVSWVATTKLPLHDATGRIIGTCGISRDITERKRAEEALQEAGERFQLVTRATNDAVWDWNLTSPAWWNDVFYEVYGFDRNIPPSLEAWASHIHPDDQERVMARFRAVVEHGETVWSDEFRFKRADGTYGHVFDRAYSLRNASGKTVRMIGSMIDITERKRAEQALKESEVRYQRISEAITDYIYTVRVADGRAVETTHGPGCLAVTGYRSEEFANNLFLWLRMVAAEDRPKVEEQARRILAGKDPPPIEHRIVHKNGTLRWVRNTFVPHRDERGALVTYDGLIQDITGRKHAEQALRTSEAELRVILESTADGILAVDSQGKVIKANQRFVELWRIPQSLMDAGDDRALLDFVLAQLSDADAFLKKVLSLYGTDAVAMDTLVFKDGRVFERYSFPMMMDGAVIGRVWSFRDITERKRQERELSEKSVELERFTYTVSHDLKSPLVTVKTFLGYLEQDLLNPDAERIKQDVGYMRTAADKMGHLLDELLNLARVGRKSNPPVRVTFQQLAQEAVGLVAGRIRTSRAEVQVADAAVVLEGDRPRLVEIWQNLVENACKFMADQPKPRVEIGVEQRGAETVFFVRDNGVGIEPRYHEKVFSLFEKLNPKIEGTGMGLALVKRVVELYKGRIWVESGGHGQGANFLFTLPAAVIIEVETEQSL